MNQFLSNKIVSGIVALALLVGVGVLISSGDTSSTTRNAALVAGTPCTKVGQFTKVSKQAVVCAALLPKNIWYPVFQEKKWICAKLGITRKQNGIFSVCGKSKSSKKRWFLTKPVMANSAPGLPTTDQDAFIKLTTNPELIVETSPTTPIALAPTTETTLAPTTETTLAPTTETTLAPTTETTPKTYQVGETGPGGGKVFYVATTPFTCGKDLRAECTSLEAAKTDYEVNDARASVAWGCYGTATGATATAIGTGNTNTATILAKCTTVGIAADVANKYSTNTAGAGQWFLPSKDELNELCKIYSDGRTDTTLYESKQNGCTGNSSPTGGYAAGYYWSSSESYAGQGWFQDFRYGFQDDSSEVTKGYVRPVRAFSTTTIARTYQVGETGPGGGKVFYVATTPFTCGKDLKATCTYLEAAPTDYQVNGSRAGVAWGCYGTATEATATEIGTGKANTTKILEKCRDSGIAARVAADYQGGGKSDWFLPSKDELKQMRDNRVAIGGFDAGYYWSSSENYAGTALTLDFITTQQHFTFMVMKDYTSGYVRPVRAF